jgi:hypothetical protein
MAAHDAGFHSSARMFVREARVITMAQLAAASSQSYHYCNALRDNPMEKSS